MPLFWFLCLIFCNLILSLWMAKHESHWYALSLRIEPLLPLHAVAQIMCHWPNELIMKEESPLRTPFKLNAARFNWNTITLNLGTIHWQVSRQGDSNVLSIKISLSPQQAHCHQWSLVQKHVWMCRKIHFNLAYSNWLLDYPSSFSQKWQRCCLFFCFLCARKFCLSLEQ